MLTIPSSPGVGHGRALKDQWEEESHCEQGTDDDGAVDDPSEVIVGEHPEVETEDGDLG